MKRIALAVVLMSLALVAACSEPYRTAAKLAQDVAVTVNQGTQTVDQFRVAGQITPNEERSILLYLNSINVFNGQYIACVKSVHDQPVLGGLTKCVNALQSGIGDPATLAAFHVSNPASQVKVIAIGQGIAAIVNVVSVNLGGK